jgi:hypothetical protein
LFQGQLVIEALIFFLTWFLGAWSAGALVGAVLRRGLKSLELLEGLVAAVAVTDGAARGRAEEVLEPRIG